MSLDLSSFEKALQTLKLALDEHQKHPDNMFVIDSCIQRFEYTYEISWKMLKRFLEMTEPSEENIDILGFSDLIRTGSEKGLLKNGWPSWSVYKKSRDLTSHTYNLNTAMEILKIIPDFFEDAQFLYDEIKNRQS